MPPGRCFDAALDGQDLFHTVGNRQQGADFPGNKGPATGLPAPGNKKAKQDAGADRAITQFFFNPDDYFRLLDEAAKAGVTMPIVMLTTSREESDVVNALQNGARGYLLKDMEPEELIKALE